MGAWLPDEAPALLRPHPRRPEAARPPRSTGGGGLTAAEARARPSAETRLRPRHGRRTPAGLLPASPQGQEARGPNQNGRRPSPVRNQGTLGSGRGSASQRDGARWPRSERSGRRPARRPRAAFLAARPTRRPRAGVSRPPSRPGLSRRAAAAPGPLGRAVCGPPGAGGRGLRSDPALLPDREAVGSGAAPRPGRPLPPASPPPGRPRPPPPAARRPAYLALRRSSSSNCPAEPTSTTAAAASAAPAAMLPPPDPSNRARAAAGGGASRRARKPRPPARPAPGPRGRLEKVKPGAADPGLQTPAARRCRESCPPGV